MTQKQKQEEVVTPADGIPTSDIVNQLIESLATAVGVTPYELGQVNQITREQLETAFKAVFWRAEEQEHPIFIVLKEILKPEVYSVSKKYIGHLKGLVTWLGVEVLRYGARLEVESAKEIADQLSTHAVRLRTPVPPPIPPGEK